jgi:rod shape-determining protein MreD
MRLGAAVALGFALLVIRSTVLPMVGLAAIGPDLLFPLVVFYGASGRFGSGVAAALVLGYLADVMCGGNHGVHLYLYGMGFVTAALAAGRLDLEGTLVPCALVFTTSLVSGFTLILLFGVWDQPLPRPAGGLLLESLLTALFAIPLLPVLRATQRFTTREDSLVLPSR